LRVTIPLPTISVVSKISNSQSTENVLSLTRVRYQPDCCSSRMSASVLPMDKQIAKGDPTNRAGVSYET
jgi:hypothetical protein